MEQRTTSTANATAGLAHATRPIDAAISGASDRCWVVGGAVRDALLGRDIRDLDLVCEHNPESLARAVARELDAAAFPLSDRHGCWRVTLTSPVQDLVQIDVCRRVGESLEADLASRDFTVNAIAWDPQNEAFVDPLCGADDLAAGRAVAASDHAFDDDPLRVLRLAWMAVAFGLVPDERTLRLARAAAPDIVQVSGERIFEKLSTMLLGDRPRRAMRWIDELGLTGGLIPELAACKDLEQTRFHHLDAYEHTLAVLDNAADIATHPAHYFPGTAASPLDDDARLVLHLGAVFHDLGKPLTRTPHEDGGASFVGHEREGAAIVNRVLREWGVSNSIRDRVRQLTMTHLALGFLIHHPVDRRVAWQYLQRVRGVEREAVCLSLADRLATVGAANKRRWQRRHVEVARTIWAEIDRYDAEGHPEPLLDGIEIARIAGIEPGPALGHLVAMLCEAQAIGEVSSSAEAEEFIRSLPPDLPAARR